MPLNLYSKESTDTLLAAKLDLAGGTMTGGLTLSASGIIFSDATYLTTAPAGSTLAADQLTAGVVAANPTSGPTTAGDVLQYNGSALVWAAGGGGSFNGGAISNPITIAGATIDSEMSSDFFGVELSADHTKGSVLYYTGLDTYDGSSHMLVGPTGLTFPDSTTQTTAGQTASDVSTYVTGLGYQTASDVSTYVGANAYPLSSNPAGYLTSIPARTVNNQSSGGSYYLASGDVNNIIYFNSSSSTLYIYDDSSLYFSDGAEITICVDNTSNFQVQGSTGMGGTPTVNGTTSAITLSSYVMKLVKVASNTWFIS